MQSAQVPLWVPIVVGVIGVLGVVAGQLINWLREERRWRRDREGEELRWQREKRSHESRLAHENMIGWRETRIQTYGSLLSAVRAAVDIYRNMSLERYHEQSSELFQQFLDARTTLLHVVSEAELICSAEVRAVVSAGHHVFLPYVPSFPSPVGGDPDIARARRSADQERYADYTRRAEAFRKQLIDALRAELGVEREAPVQPIRNPRTGPASAE